MKRLSFLYIIFIFLQNSFASAQLSYNNSVYNEVGEAGTMVTANLQIKNTGTYSVQVFVNRFHLNLPPDWAQCFCFFECQLPALDSLRFTMQPNEIVNIGIGFSTTAVPDTGYMRMTVEVVGGTQKDSLSFSGTSFVVNALNEFSSDPLFNVFPVPVISDITLLRLANDPYTLEVLNMSGSVLQQNLLVKEKEFKLSLNNYPAGQYYIRATAVNGKTQIKKIIKK